LLLCALFERCLPSRPDGLFLYQLAKLKARVARATEQRHKSASVLKKVAAQHDKVAQALILAKHRVRKAKV
jgi:hypothetical protein